MAGMVDSYRYTNGITKRLVKSWIKKETPRAVPWTPLAWPVSEGTVALLSSGGIALKSDHPYDQEGERRNPWGKTHPTGSFPGGRRRPTSACATFTSIRASRKRI